jgi:peptide/nickel transport system permease protein
VLALFFSVIIGVPLGVISAVRQDTMLDYVLRVVSLSGLSLPSFWLGLLILMAFVGISLHPDLYRPARQPVERAGVASAGGGGRFRSPPIMRLTRCRCSKCCARTTSAPPARKAPRPVR